LYKNVFDKELASGITYNAYMFYGECDYLVEKYANDIATKLAAGDDVYKIYFDDYNFKDCTNYLSQSSLFASSNVMIIKTDKKLNKKEVDELIANCNTNSDSYVIFACIGEKDFKTMAKSFTKKTSSVEVRFFTPYDNEAIGILNQEAKNLQLNCMNDALGYLYTMHQKDLSLCVNDLKKLAILGQPVSVGMINTQCFGMGGINMDDFLVKLFSGHNINKDLYMLLEEGMNEIQLLSQTTAFAQQLFSINTYLKLYGELNIKEIWGYNLPKNIANTRANLAMRFKQEDFCEMLNYFQNLELELKTKTGLDVNPYIQSCFRNFSASIR
jgi:DNA polymerase-3 subunit delta